MPIPIANADNWESVWSDSVIAEPGGRPWLIRPIGDRVCPIQIDSPFLAVYPWFDADPNTTQHLWRFAGFAVQQFQVGVSGTPAPTTQAGVWRKIWLNQLQFVVFEDWQLPYGLTFKVPKYFPNWKIQVWQCRISSVTSEALIQQLSQAQQSRQLQLMEKLQALELSLMEVQSTVEYIESRV